MATTYTWQFAPRFRCNVFGWKSDIPILRIKEALAEIKAVAKKEPVIAAEGAVHFLEKLAPAIEQVDSSSGSIGSAVNRAMETLVPIIAKADVATGHGGDDPCTKACPVDTHGQNGFSGSANLINCTLRDSNRLCATRTITAGASNDSRAVDLTFAADSMRH